MGVLHEDPDVRSLYVDYKNCRYRKRKLTRCKEIGNESLNGTYDSLRVRKSKCEQALLKDILGPETAKLVNCGYAMLGLHCWLARVLRRQGRWLGALRYLGSEQSVQALKNRFALS